jgi:CubicO group peptidase (beta-lactamase class C family)
MTRFRVLAITATIAASTSGLIARPAGRQALNEQRALDSAVERLFALDLTPGMSIAADRARLALPHAAAGAGYRQLPSKADSTMHAAGGHVTTARDLTRWIEAHLNRGRVDGRQVFPAAVVAETHGSTRRRTG